MNFGLWRRDSAPAESFRRERKDWEREDENLER